MQTLLRDARATSATSPYGPVGTFQGFDLAASLVDRIDYIFFSANSQVLTYGVLTDSLRGRYPSDHFPVVADVVVRPTMAQ